MLSKDKRLNLKKDFTWVAAGEKSGNKIIRLFFRFGENGAPRIGIAVSKSVFKKAVERNRARRLVSAGFEQLYEDLPEGVNIIVLPKEEILTMTSEEVAGSLKNLLLKVKLLKE